MKQYGIESYIAVPLYRPDGTVLGTLCALDPEPARLAPDDLDLLRMLSQLITHELRAGEELRLLHRMGQNREQLMGIVGHDLRNPLTTIHLSALALRKDPSLSRDHLRELTLIERGAHRMNRIVVDLLDITRSQLGRGLPVEKKSADLHDLCIRAVREYRSIYPERRIELELEGGGEGMCDPDRMFQVLSNLMGNALMHGPEESPISVRAGDDGERVIIQVRNGGFSIPREVLPTLFQPSPRWGEEGGLGLGLYIADQIVRSHGGTLQVRSAAGSGTTFTIALPRS